MKKLILITFFIVSIILLSSIYFVYSFLNKTKVGDKLDSYKNVIVYENGKVGSKTYGSSFSKDGYYYGLKWQCVEFVKRFYYDAKKHKMPDGYGNAKDFFDLNIKHSQKNKIRGMIQYYNGKDIAPKVDDLVVFQDSTFGHVAIITKVSKDNIELIQQNVYKKTRQKYTLTKTGSNFTIGDKRKPIGWLRLE